MFYKLNTCINLIHIHVLILKKCFDKKTYHVKKCIQVKKNQHLMQIFWPHISIVTRSFVLLFFSAELMNFLYIVENLWISMMHFMSLLYFRAEKSEVLSEDLQTVEKRVELVKTVCQSTSKKIAGCLQGQGTDYEKRLVQGDFYLELKLLLSICQIRL